LKSESQNEKNKIDDLHRKIDSLRHKRKEMKTRIEKSEELSKKELSIDTENSESSIDQSSEKEIEIDRRPRVDFIEIRETFEKLFVRLRAEKVPIQEIERILDREGFTDLEITISQLKGILSR